jgi:4-amino-4-deoxy-L-arabinose transferase-like glycosyltransferase
LNFKNFIQNHFQRIQIILTAAVILAAVMYMAFTYWTASERYGIGINSDSIAYIRSAENLLQGNGLGRVNGLGSFKPMTHWPPLYSLVLAAGQSLGSDLYDSARIIGLVLNIMLVILIGKILFKLSRSVILTGSGLSLFVLALPFWETTFRIMSEPLFLVCVLAGILTLDKYLETKSRRWLIISAIWMAFAILTRYAAVVFIAPACILLLAQAKYRLSDRIKRVVLYGLISCIPFGIWIGVNQWIAGTATNRVFLFNPISSEDVSLLWVNVSSWFTPAQTFFNIGSGKILVFCILIGILYIINKLKLPDGTTSRSNPSPLAVYFLCLIPLYICFVLVSRFYFDSMIQIYRERIIFPIFLAIFLLIFYGISRLIQYSRLKPFLAGGVIVLLLSFCWVSFFQGYKVETTKFLSQAKRDGIGFAGIRKNPPAFIDYYLSLSPADIKLSNNIELFYLLTGQDALTLSNDFTQADIDRLNKYLQSQSAYYVVFNSRKIEKHLVELNPDVSLIYQDTDGGIYRYH